MTLSIFKSSRLVTGALVLSSGVFLAACTSLADPAASAQTDVAAESVEVVEGTVETVSKPDDMAMDEMPMEGMSKDEMPMDDMSKDEMSMDDMSMDEKHAECMKKHKGMMGEMADGEKMSHEGHTPEMMEKHTKCMEAAPEMGEMHEGGKHMHKSDETVTEESTDAVEAPPHAH